MSLSPFFVIFFLSVLGLTVGQGQALFMSDEKRLTSFLLANYERMGIEGRPVADPSQAVDVQAKMSIIQIMDVDLEAKTLELVAWFHTTWTDNLLTWNPPEFGNTEQLSFDPKGRIWTPDVVFYNAVAVTKEMFDVRVAVTHDGLIHHVVPMRMTLSCMDFEKGQTETSCLIKAGSWVYSTDKLNLVSSRDTIDLDYYRINYDWELVSNSAEVVRKTYDCCPDDVYSHIAYTVTLRKRSHGDEF